MAAILFLLAPSQNYDRLLDKLLVENLIKRYLRHVALMKWIQSHDHHGDEGGCSDQAKLQKKPIMLVLQHHDCPS